MNNRIWNWVLTALAVGLLVLLVRSQFELRATVRELRNAQKPRMQPRQSGQDKPIAPVNDRRTQSEQKPENISSATLAMAAILDRIDVLKSRLQATQHQSIPEIQLLTDKDWVSVVQDNELQTDKDLTKAFAQLRERAETHALAALSSGLDSYLQASGGILPSDINQLQPYLNIPLSIDILQRYTMLASGAIANQPSSAWLIGLQPSAAVDQETDSAMYIFANGWGSRASTPEMPLYMVNEIQVAQQAYSTANNGAVASDPQQLISYFSNPSDAQRYLTYAQKKH